MDRIGTFEIILILSIVFVKFAIIMIAFLVIKKRKERNVKLYLDEEARRKDSHNAANNIGM